MVLVVEVCALSLSISLALSLNHARIPYAGGGSESAPLWLPNVWVFLTANV